MATKREEIIVSLGGDSKALLKELKMTKQAANAWGRDIAKEITSGRIPDAWKSYSTNVKNALKEIDSEGKKTSQSFAENMTNSAKKVIAAFVGFQMVKKVFVEIGQAMTEVSAKIDEFNDKIDVAGYTKAQQKKKFGGMSEKQQQGIVVGNFVVNDAIEDAKIGAAKAGGLLGMTAMGLFWRAAISTMAGNSPGQTAKSLLPDKEKIWAGMKVVASEEKLKKLAEDKAKAEKEQTAARAQRLKLIDAEMEAWRKQNELARGILQGKQDRVNKWRENAGERIAIAGEYNEQAMLENLPGNPTAGERRNADQAALVERIRAYGLQKPKTIREQMEARLAAKNQPKMTAQDAMNKLASIITEDAMLVRVKLAK